MDDDLWRVSVTPTIMSGNTAYLVAMAPLTSLLKSRQMLLWVVILITMAGFLISLQVGKMVAGRAIIPLKAINRALSKVSIENIVFSIVAYSIWTLENLWDIFNAENEAENKDSFSGRVLRFCCGG